MEPTNKSRFIENKSKYPPGQNGLKGSNQIQQKKNNLSIRNNYITPSQALREMNKTNGTNAQQKQVTKNIWMSSFRDIIKDEPVKVNLIKKAPVAPTKNTIKKTPTLKQNNNNTANKSSKPVFTISASLKNSMQQQSPKIKNNSNISQNPKPATSEIISSKNVVNNNKPKSIPVERPKTPQKIEAPVINITPNKQVLEKSPIISSKRSFSPSVQKYMCFRFFNYNVYYHVLLTLFVIIY